MKTTLLVIALGLLAVARLAADNIYIAPMGAGGGQVPAAANFGGDSPDPKYPGWAELETTTFSFDSLGAGGLAGFVNQRLVGCEGDVLEHGCTRLSKHE